MAMMVSPEVAKLFQVLTGEEWPDADEDQLRVLAGEWQSAALGLGQLAEGLRNAIAAISADFEGVAAETFVERVSPFIEGDNLIDAAAELFNSLANTLLDLALDVEYMKLVIIYSLIELMAEMAWAAAMAPFTAGATLDWLAARIAIVRFMIETWLRRLILEVLQLVGFSIAFQLLIDVAAQLTQYAMGTRNQWNTKYTINAVGVGAMGAALAFPIGGLGKILSGGANKFLTNAFAKKTIENLTEIGTEAFHETLTEALYLYATEGRFEMNPFAATAGAASGGSEVTGGSIGKKLFKKDNNEGSGSDGGSDRGGSPDGPPTDNNTDPSGGPFGHRPGGQFGGNNGPSDRIGTNNSQPSPAGPANSQSDPPNRSTDNATPHAVPPPATQKEEPPAVDQPHGSGKSGLPHNGPVPGTHQPEAHQPDTRPSNLQGSDTARHHPPGTNQINTSQQNQQNQQNRHGNPFADQIAAAAAAVDGAAQARDNVASTLGPVRVDNKTAQQSHTSIEQATRGTHGAVIATEQAFGPNSDRIAQAQQNLTHATDNLNNARDNRDQANTNHEQAADNLAAARENRSDAGIRHWGKAERDLARRLENAGNAVDQANNAYHQAVQDLDHARATEISVTAARDAHNTATTALNTANNAVTTTNNAYTQIQGHLDAANNAVAHANTVLDNLHNAADRANTTHNEFVDLTNQADNTRDQVADLNNQRHGLIEQLNQVNDQLANAEPDQQQHLNDQRDTLNERITDLDNRTTALTEQASNLDTRAEGAKNGYDGAVRDFTENLSRIDNHVGGAHNAETAANLDRDNAKDAAQQAAEAKDTAKDARKQADVESGLTQLSFLPHDSELHIETLGPRDQLIDGIANVTGVPHGDVADQVNAMSDDEVTSAINNGSISITAPNGKVDVTIHTDLHRPTDTRTAPRHQQPAAIKSESADESGVPKSESASSSVPIRVPLLFISPVDLAGTAVRPMVYVGATGRRGQKFESSTTSKNSTSTEQTSHVPTTISLTLSTPGNIPVTSSIDAGLRLPNITRADPILAPLPNGNYAGVKSAPAVVPPAFHGLLGNSPGGAKGPGEQLLTPDQAPKTVTVGGMDVVITPTGPAQVTYVGTTPSDSSHSTSHGNSWQTTMGSDANFGFGVFAGPKSWFVGGFADFSTGLTDGSTPAVEDSVTQSGKSTDLYYRIDRPMRVDQGGANAQDTVSGMVKVPVVRARELGLPLPPHLQGSKPGPAGQQYVFGRDDIKSVSIDPVKDFVTQNLTDTPNGLSDTGRNAIGDLFSSQDVARNTIYDAMHGGAQASWTKGGTTHIVDIHAVAAPPATTQPSGQTDTSSEVNHADKVGRTYGSARTARFGVGGAFLPVGTDSPNQNPPTTTPEGGNPNPYQGGPTTATAAPRASIALNWESGISNKSGFAGKDGRTAKYEGEMRDYDGPIDLVVVHRTTPAPNWAQRFFFDDRMLFGPNAGHRLTGPTRSQVEQALAGNNTHPDIRTGRVDDAIKVSTPADKLDWATKPLPRSTMTPGIYLGYPPVLPNPEIDPKLFGEFTNTEHVRVSQNVTEGVHIALAKRIERVDNGPHGDGQQGGATRRPPKGSGNWSTWGKGEFTETRDTPDGQQVTNYTYKHSDLTRPGTAPGDAVREFVGKVGSHGTASQGFGGRPNSTGKMLREGRVSDFNGTLEGRAEYSGPRLVDVRPESTLRRSQAGDQVAGSTKSSGVGVDGEVSGGVIPRRDTGTGAVLNGVVGGGGKHGRSDALDVTSGGKQNFEYKGPTAFVAMDVRYQYSANMNLRNMFHQSGFDTVPVTVDEPDGVLVEMPVSHAIDMFTRLGLPVPPELSGLRPKPKTPIDDPAHTLLTPNGDYASYSDTSVFNARLTDSLDGVGDRLAELGVKSSEWRAEILNQIDMLLNSPAGHVWLRDPLTGNQGHGGLISVPNPDVMFEDIVDIRVTTEPAQGVQEQPAVEKVVPNTLTTSANVSVSGQDKESTTLGVSGAINVGVRHGTTPATPPGQPDANGVVQQAQPNAGASSGAFMPQVFGGAKSWKTETMLDGSGSTKHTTQVDTDKVGRDTRQVVHTLEISRRRSPMPAFDTVGLGIPKHVNWNKPGRETTLNGEVDLVSPGSNASPPLTKPTRAPEFQVLTNPPPNNPPLFGPNDGWRVEKIGTDTVKAIHDAPYAQLSDKPPTRQNPTANQIAESAAATSEYTRPGSNSEYILHNAVKGTSVHNVSNHVFSGGEHKVGNILGSKHPAYDSLFDYTLTGDLQAGNLRFLKALPPDTKMNLSQDRETATPKGTTKTVTTGFGPAVTSSGANTHDAAGPVPTTVNFLPPVSETIGNDEVTATSSKTANTGGRKYEGRSYLFIADRADFYSNVKRHGSNWVHKPLTAVKDAFGGRPHRPESTVRISSFGDMHVRMWENTALDKGLLTIGNVWEHADKLPTGTPYTVTPDGQGATIHPPGQQTRTPAPPTTGPPGRNLHIAPGVSQADVTSFVGSLPSDMRPITYTVDPGQPFTATDILSAVSGLPEPKKPDTDGTTAENEPETDQTPPEEPKSAAPAPQPSGGEGKVPMHPPTDSIGGQRKPEQKHGQSQSHRDLAGAKRDGSPWEQRHLASPLPGAGGNSTPRPGKRSRDDFEAGGSPVTTYEPPHVRPVPERLVEPSPADTAALLDVVQPGHKFADPATFVGLINGTRSGQGRDVNCVDATLAFHATYHGDPRVAGSAPGGLPRGAGTAAAEELGYAPELHGRGPAGLGEVIARVGRAGHGADALVFGFPRSGAGHAWNVVNHDGAVSIVDAQGGTIGPATPGAVPWLDRVYAIPLDAAGNVITGGEPAPTPPERPDPYATAEYERAVWEHRIRVAAAAGEEIPVPGTNGRLVPTLGGLRLVGAAVTASVAADLAAMSGRDVIALVIGAGAEDDDDEGEPVTVPKVLRFPPRGRPEPVGGE